MKKKIMEWRKVIIFAAIISLVIAILARPTIITGESMTPTLGHGCVLFVNQLNYKTKEPTHGDIIVFKSNIKVDGKKIELIKRVIALEGEQITIGDGKVFINQEELEEPYIPQGMLTLGELDGVVPKGRVFVLGDNRINSTDSRSYKVGSVKVDAVVGKAYFRLLPLSLVGSVR
ncbi:signal peptidase I [Alkaliphilus metalliredigens QYMF]|uniref:Signal peptidase I n=1 Tax=Alkaliphilus metalliredigens (strain QYMF) TaxID=293826 RepID=A6TU87_ALKMQ|nr:signal peptidase I [Alkaliphilus metalliredigens]ABR49755.1 signal peptidase I [Alkaliphilus metalliredigens QYMF]